MTTATPPGDDLAPKTAQRRRAEVICVTAIIAKSIFALVLLPLTPSLLGTDPVLLEALRGTTSAMVSGGAFARVGEASPVLAFIAPFPTLIFVTPFFWWAGRLWGPKAADLITGNNPRASRWVTRIERWLDRWGGLVVLLSPYLPVPAALIDAAAGWTGMSLRRFLIWDVLGMASWIGVIVGLGYAIGHPAVRVAKDISHYGLEFTIALIVVAMVIGGVRGSRMAAAEQRLSDERAAAENAEDASPPATD